MREILFRGKRIDNGEWIQGFFAVLGDDYYIAPDVNAYTSMGGRGKGRCMLFGNYYQVIPKTVGQFTELTDMNGKKIFDGDILEETRGNEPYRDVVVANRWNCSCCDGVYGYAFEHHEERLDFRYLRGCIVVGNIHDNHELLEVEE